MTDAEQKQLDEWKRVAREWKAKAEAAEATLAEILDVPGTDPMAAARLWCDGTVRRRMDAGEDLFPEAQSSPSSVLAQQRREVRLAVAPAVDRHAR